MEDEEHGLVAIRCSSTKNKRPDQINKPHNLVLTKWKEYGLNEESYFVGTDARLLQYVSLREKIGQISGEVLEKCRKKFNSFKEERNSAPDMLMDYLLYVSIKSPNESYRNLTMQSSEDVIKNERGNSIDISTLVYSVFSKYYIPFKIVSTNLLNNKTITGSHFWCMLMHNNRLKAFRFVSGDPSNGELCAYNTKDIDSAINYESEWLLKYFSKIIPVNRFDNYVLDEADEMQWMSFVDKKEKQSKLIDYIRSKRNSSDNFFFYHMVPKGTDVSKGLLAPAALSKLGMQTELDNALNKYRERMVKGWRIYPDKLPEELTTDELITGLEKFRGEGGARTIYFFRYPPTKILGKNMADILKEKDIYRIDLNDPEIQKFIDKVDWGNYLSNTDNPAYNKQWYENISEKDYFSNYDDNPANGMPLFASIPHIGVAFKDGICPREFLTLVTKSSDITTESVTEIPENSIEYRFEEWENGETNLLFITGLSGSGKSTLAQKLAKEFNCDYYEIDFWVKKIDKQHPGIESLSKEERRSIRVRGVIDYALKKNRRCIIEGAQIVFTDPNWYKPYSLIVVGTSLLVSTYRMIKRGFTDREREAKFAGTDDPIKLFLYTLFTGVPHNIQWNRAQYSVQKEFEKHFIEESVNLNPGDVVPGYPTRVFVCDLGDGSYCFDDTQLGVRMRTLNDKENGYTTDNLEANFASYIPTSTEVVDENIVEEAHKYIQKRLTYEEVKKNMTFIYDNDGIPNGVYEIDGEKYRVRVETIVKREVNGTHCIFFEKKKEVSHYGSMYKIPGGSVEPDKSLSEQAECEVNEEILVKVKNVNYTGKYYIVKYDPKTIPEWHKRILWPIGLKYVGAITFVFTAEYDGPYRKKVAKVDQDSLAQKGDWYPVWEFEEIKADVHQGIALESMEVVEEASIYTQEYRDFDEFCEYIQTPEEVATWYSKNHVIWPPGETGSNHPFRWPDDIVKHKIGNCYDHALFMHYFCNRKGIVNKQIRTYVVLINRNERTGEAYSNYCGHIVTLFEKDGQWYEFDPQPHRQKSGHVIEGPFDSIDEYLEDVTECMKIWGRKLNIGYETKCGTYVYSEDEQKVWDKFYNAPIKDRDEFTAKYLSKSDKTFADFRNGKMNPVEQKQYFEYLRVRAAILMLIIRHGIKRVKNEVVNFFNESTNFDLFVNQLKSMEVVEESDNSLVGTKIIPVDLRKYNKPGTRVLCFNPHITKTMAKALGRTAKNAFKSAVFEKEKDRFMTNMAWDGFDLFMQYSKSIMAVDIVSVNEDQCLTADLEGFPVIACESGKVVHAQDGVGEANIFNRLRDPVGPEGNTVIIAHDNKTVTLYAHLQNNSITVRKGDIVHKGQVIGRVGNTGDCTIPHLHFETSGTTWKDAGIGRQHVGFAPFMCTDIGIIDAFKKSTYDEAYKTPMEINDTGVFGTAFFLTNDSRYVKESTEVVAEGFFSKGKKNIIPLDLDYQLAPGRRILCANTHNINITISTARWFIDYIKEYKKRCADSFFNIIIGIPDFMKFMYEITFHNFNLLKDQIFAVDMFDIDDSPPPWGKTESIKGCPILACNDGKVVAIIHKDKTFEVQSGEFKFPSQYKENIAAFGNAILIEHENGEFYSMYAHILDGSFKVKIGQVIKRGDEIAEVGNTGNSSAAHLHFELFYNTKLAGPMPKQRQNFEPYGKTDIELDDETHKVKTFYDELEIDDSGNLGNWIFLTDPPTRYVKEMLDVIEESAKQFKSSKAQNFEDFCKECKTPEDAMNWFIANKVVWNDKANDDKMRWPDTLVKERKGNCLDQSVMMHFFFKKRKIEHRMALFTIRLENGTTAGHIFPLFRRGKYIFAWLYIGPGHGVITGPYHSWYEAAGMVTEFYKVLLLSGFKKGFDSPISDDTEWSVQEYSETEHLDKYLNKDIVQKDYLYGDGGDNLWSTHFFSRDFHFIRIPKVTGVIYKLIAWSKQYQTPKEKKLAKEALELIKSGGLEPVQEEYKLSVYTKQYKTMDEFCKQFKTFDDLVIWFQTSHIKWPDYKERNKIDPVDWIGEIHWPEDLLRDKIGNCFDQALFAYYFCKKNNIPARMYRFARFHNTNNSMNATMECTSHFVTMVQRKSGYYIFSYSGVFNDTAGPFPSYEKAAEKYKKRMAMFFYLEQAIKNQMFKLNMVSKKKNERRLIIKYGYFNDNDIQFIDRLYGDKHLTQNELIKKSGGCMFPEDGRVIKYTPFEVIYNAIRGGIGSGGYNIGMLLASKEATEEPIDVKNVVPMGICDYVLQYLGNAVDIQKFADIKSGRRFMYTYCTVMKKHIPLILLLAYCEGLTTVLRKAEVNFFFTDTRPRIKEYESVLKGVIPFADGYLVYDKFPLEVSLLMNGLALVDTKGFEYAEMDGKDVYVSLFDILFGTRMLANAFDNFYDWMIDPVTYTVLQDLNYPTDFVGLLLAGNKLLADNNYTDELDMRNYRVRSNEMAYAYAFKKISEAYGKFRMTSNNKNPDKISIPQGSVIKDIMQSQMVEDVSELSPIVEVEKAHTISDKGPSGTNLKEAYTMRRRCYHPSMVGSIAIAQSPDVNVGITRTLTMEPNIVNARGYVRPDADKELNDANIFSMGEYLTPLALNHDKTIVEYASNCILPNDLIAGNPR